MIDMELQEFLSNWGSVYCGSNCKKNTGHDSDCQLSLLKAYHDFLIERENKKHREHIEGILADRLRCVCRVDEGNAHKSDCLIRLRTEERTRAIQIMKDVFDTVTAQKFDDKMWIELDRALDFFSQFKENVLYNTN